MGEKSETWASHRPQWASWMDTAVRSGFARDRPPRTGQHGDETAGDQHATSGWQWPTSCATGTDGTGPVARAVGLKNKNFCRDPKLIINLAGETPAVEALTMVNTLSV